MQYTPPQNRYTPSQAGTVQSQAAIPSPLDFLSMLWNDILRFFAMLTGRTMAISSAGVAGETTPSSAPANVVPVRTAKPTISVQQALTMAIATESPINPRDLNGYMRYGPTWDAAVRNYTVYFDTSICGGQSAPSIGFQQAGALAISGVGTILSVAGKAAMLAGPVGWALGGASLAISVVANIFQHHAGAVQRDKSAYCGTVPAINNALKVIIEEGQAGTITPAQTVAGLQAIVPQALIAMGPAKNNHPYCNALCEKIVETRVIVNYWVSQFEAME